jgi:hypothetical protein
MPPAAAAFRFLTCLLVIVLLLSMAGTAMAAMPKKSVLEKNQYAYSAALRWGDFEGAWSMVDPKVREEKPISAADHLRYEQIQIVGYREISKMPGPDETELREIELEFVHRSTNSRRSVRYTEVWRFDTKARNWWIAGLPDIPFRELGKVGVDLQQSLDRPAVDEDEEADDDAEADDGTEVAEDGGDVAAR